MYEKLPQELKEYPYFCGWKYENHNGNRTKVPKTVKGRNADNSNLKDFCGFDEIITKIDELFRADKAEERAAAKEAEALKETAVEKTSAKEEKKQERPSLKERLAQKKDVVAKNEANREPRQMNKDRGAQALA